MSKNAPHSTAAPDRHGNGIGGKPPPMSLGEKLKTLRTQRHLTLKTVATHAKISPGYLSQLETGKKRQPSAEILARKRNRR